MNTAAVFRSRVPILRPRTQLDHGVGRGGGNGSAQYPIPYGNPQYPVSYGRPQYPIPFPPWGVGMYPPHVLVPPGMAPGWPAGMMMSGGPAGHWPQATIPGNINIYICGDDRSQRLLSSKKKKKISRSSKSKDRSVQVPPSNHPRVRREEYVETVFRGEQPVTFPVDQFNDGMTQHHTVHRSAEVQPATPPPVWQSVKRGTLISGVRRVSESTTSDAGFYEQSSFGSSPRESELDLNQAQHRPRPQLDGRRERQPGRAPPSNPPRRVRREEYVETVSNGEQPAMFPADQLNAGMAQRPTIPRSPVRQPMSPTVRPSVSRGTVISGVRRVSDSTTSDAGFHEEASFGSSAQHRPRSQPDGRRESQPGCAPPSNLSRRVCREEVVENVDHVSRSEQPADQFNPRRAQLPTKYPVGQSVTSEHHSKPLVFNYTIPTAGLQTTTAVLGAEPATTTDAASNITITSTAVEGTPAPATTEAAMDRSLNATLSTSSNSVRKSSDRKSQMQEETNRKMAMAATQAFGQLEQIKAQSEREIEELTKGKKSAMAKFALLEEHTKAAEAEIKELRRHKQISTAEHRKLKEITQVMQLQHSNLNNSLKMGRKQLSDLKAEYTDLDAENADVKQKLQTNAVELAEANSVVAKCKADVDALTAETAARDRRYQQNSTAMRAELTKLKDQKAASDTLYRQNITAMRAELAELKNHHRTLSALAETEYPKFVSGLKGATQTLVAASETVIEDATKNLMVRYKYESRERKLLYNYLQELRGNIRVFCRVRSDDRTACVLRFPDKNALGTPTELICPNPNDPTLSKRFEFDRVFNPEDNQSDVFDDTEPVITSTVDGYNVSIIAYGQTGSGKTYTMMGTEDNPGVNRRAIRELLRVCDDRANINYSITVSLLEIYNDSIIDLLSDLSAYKQDCKLRTDPATNLGFVSGLNWRGIKTIEDVVQALLDGEETRSVAYTKMNSASSRSHLVLTLEVTGVDKVTKEKTVGKLRMVDLAGSERNSKSGATGQQLVEANAINTSLSALGQVFIGLRAGDKHIPFRNSKLTHLLQDSLGGQSKTCFFVNISPSESNLQETMCTLQFGNSIRKVLLKKARPATPGTARKGLPATLRSPQQARGRASEIQQQDRRARSHSPLTSGRRAAHDRSRSSSRDPSARERMLREC